MHDGQSHAAASAAMAVLIGQSKLYFTTDSIGIGQHLSTQGCWRKTGAEAAPFPHLACWQRRLYGLVKAFCTLRSFPIAAAGYSAENKKTKNKMERAGMTAGPFFRRQPFRPTTVLRMLRLLEL